MMSFKTPLGFEIWINKHHVVSIESNGMVNESRLTLVTGERYVVHGEPECVARRINYE